MKSIVGMGLSLGFMALATHSSADDDFIFLRPDSIRAAYESQRENWLPISPVLKDAFLVAEDRDFFDGRASWSTLTRTITYWYPERGWALEGARLEDLAVTTAISGALDHSEIFDWFIHGTYLGQGCWGVDGASDVYFGKLPSEIELHEAALLAVLVKDPNLFKSDRSRDRALGWRNHILGELAQHGYVSEAEADIASTKPIDVRHPLGECPSQGG